MLSFAGETLIERQIRLFNSVGVNDIIIVTGYKSEKINYNNARYYKNVDYENTNMLESLFTAENEFNEEIIITYSDILFEKSILVGLLKLKELILKMIYQNTGILLIILHFFWFRFNSIPINPSLTKD